MIGPSSGTGGVPNHEVSDNQSRTAKKRIFDDLDIEKFCEEVQNSRKRYHLQELETPMELVASNQMIDDTTTLFSPLSAQEAVEECPVARLEVLLVDGTNCTWTTVSALESQQNVAEITASPSTSSSSSEHRQEHMIQDIQVDDANYKIGSNYWQPVVTIPSPNLQQNKPSTPSNYQHQQQQFDDQETGNLSWLLDFKLDPFIEAADDKSIVSLPRDNYSGSKTKICGRPYGSTYITDNKKGFNASHENGSTHQDTNQSYSNLDNRNFASSRCNGPKKPPFTYTELIEHALREKGELTVSAIYQWISLVSELLKLLSLPRTDYYFSKRRDELKRNKVIPPHSETLVASIEHFPYYKSNDDRWKNSVRHNLSINPHFRKGSKAPHGAGHLWAIANRSGDSRPRQTINTSTIISSTKQTTRNSLETENLRRNISQMTSIDEVEAATASIMQQSSEEETENIVNSVTLEHCAEQILSGIKKEVEVQYLVPMVVPNNEHDSTQANQQTQELHYPVKESDFLNPVSKEVVAEECGLISEGYLVTDLNSATLGLNMVEPEIITPENLFGEELSFQFYELSSPSQIQSA